MSGNTDLSNPKLTDNQDDEKKVNITPSSSSIPADAKTAEEVGNELKEFKSKYDAVVNEKNKLKEQLLELERKEFDAYRNMMEYQLKVLVSMNASQRDELAKLKEDPKE